jgi:hypothetical protein
MTINEWLCDKQQDYWKGVELYQNSSQCNRHYLEMLKKKESRANLMKLRHALRKELKISPEEQSEPIELSIPDNYKVEKRTYKEVLINQLPVELHPLYIEQKANFAKACSLKIQLNDLQPHEIDHKALGIILEIEGLFESINNTWEILDYYLDYKVVLEVKNEDYSTFTAMDLLKKEKSLRSSLTRQKQRLNKLEEDYSNCVTKQVKNKIFIKLGRCKEKIIQLENSLTRLKKYL